MTIRILFICKNREFASDYNEEYTYSGGNKSSGLFNSVTFMIDMLTEAGIECKMVGVPDNNSIDKEVHAYQPTHVIIEALWVVPSKFAVLTKLYPMVTWIIRLHSEVPFIANEGVTFDWIPKYMEYDNVYVAANSKRIANDLESVYRKYVAYLPNYYPIDLYDTPNIPEENKFIHFMDTILDKLHLPTFERQEVKPISNEVHIGCFGAIRPLKNQLIQAIAAIRYADSEGLKLFFHINGNRVEGKGEPVLRNIRELFASVPRHELVEHAWLDHGDFVNLLKTLDVTMQVSFSETYNIVAADSIAAHTPVITSNEIVFVPEKFHADPTSTHSIMHALGEVLNGSRNHIAHSNFESLSRDAQHAKIVWINKFSD